jgi:hypothetical protein
VSTIKGITMYKKSLLALLLCSALSGYAMEKNPFDSLPKHALQKTFTKDGITISGYDMQNLIEKMNKLREEDKKMCKEFVKKCFDQNYTYKDWYTGILLFFRGLNANDKKTRIIVSVANL